MKLICSVEISNRLLNTLPIKTSKAKAQKSCLAIGKPSAKNEDVYLLLQTKTNKTGTKYKIVNNVEQIFSKFINEGKSTIRIKEPPHDLNIKGDPMQLRSFLHVLKLGITNKLDTANLTLSTISTNKLTLSLKTKVVIKKMSDYPTLQGFPRNTEELHIADLGRKSFDRQILKLQSLRVLNLQGNNLTNLPHEIGFMTNLQELILSKNQLGRSPESKWSWLKGISIRKKLRLLDLSSNQLKFIPNQIKNLYCLVTLNLNQNELSHMPHSIGSLKTLKYLYISKNNFDHLPGSMRNLRLQDLDISHNPFILLQENNLSCNIKVPSLLESAGRIVLKTRKYYDASIIPYTLIGYLDEAKYCMCGVACFDSYLKKLMNINLSVIAQSITVTNNNVFFECYFCSIQCYRKFSNFQRF